MFKKNWPILIAGSVLICFAVFFYYLYSKSPTYNWSQNYNQSSDSPYGNELLFELSKGLFPEKEFTKIEEPLRYNSEFNTIKSKNNIYFYSGYSFVPDRSTIASLNDFLRKGNQVFIASNEISDYFLDSILRYEFTSVMSSSNALSAMQCMQYSVQLIHPELILKIKPVIQLKFLEAYIPMQAGYFSEDFFENQSLNILDYDYYQIGNLELSNNEKYTNYIKIKLGEGWLHLYSSPLVFTNYYLSKKEVFDYAQKVFLHLEPGNIYWHVNTYASEGAADNQIAKSESPFEVLLSLRSFRYAWYSFFGAVILFSIFCFKRRQRSIPVLENNKNTSIEFAQTITKLYLADGNHKNIAEQKFRYFFNFVRTKFGINLKNNSEDDKTRLAYLSKMPIEKVEKIVFNYTKIKSLPDTTAEELNDSVVLINEFYKNSK